MAPASTKTRVAESGSAGVMRADKFEVRLMGLPRWQGQIGIFLYLQSQSSEGVSNEK
jgi:hypothetical protein